MIETSQQSLAILVGAVVFLMLLLIGLVLRGRKKSETLTLRDLQGQPETVKTPLESLPAEALPQKTQVPPISVSGDIPGDLLARDSEASAQTSVEVIHTVEEIQKREPRELGSALANTRTSFFGRLKSLFSTKEKLSKDELEEIEEILYTSDLGPGTVQRLLSAVEDRLNSQSDGGFEAVRSALREEMLGIFAALPNGHSVGVHKGSESYLEGLQHLNIWDKSPAVLMVVGVNGAGKTTTIGKLARRAAQAGRKVMVAAGDTFRAAAGDQLKVWTERAQVEIFHPENVSDPSAVAFEACQVAKSKNFDLVIIDTAGRLHTQKNLMEELKKMKRVLLKVIPDAPHEVLLVLDANSGQNALIQAKEFHEALSVTGVVLTKLDGTAKGGVAVGLACELQIPIKLIGVGEGIEDLRQFSSREFVDSII